MPHTTFPEFAWIWNRLQNQDTPGLHLDIARWLEESRADRCGRELLLLAFRNSGKSTLVGLFCAWLLARDPNLRILVLAADHALARKMVRNVKRLIERHPLTRRLKPERADQWASDQFTVNRGLELRDPSMLAKGIEANVTGSRADVVICDDVEVPNTCDTAPKRADLRARLSEIEYVLVPGGLQLYVGTPHTLESIYAAQVPRGGIDERPFLDGFRRLELPLVDAAGNSRWPERFPTESIEAIRRRTGRNKFESQMMLRPVSLAEGRLDPDLLVFYDHDLDYTEGNGEALLTLGGRRLVSASCWWDPAYGSPRKGDASVVAAVFSDDEGDAWLHRIRYLQHDPDRADEENAALQLCRQVAEFVDALFLPSVAVETNGLGRFLPGQLKQVIREQGVACSVIERCSTTAKDTRILEAFDARLEARRLHAHRSVWESPFIREMREWRPGAGRQRDDGLDAVAGCLLSEPFRLSRRPVASPKEVKERRNWRPGWGGFAAETEFDV